MIRYHEQWWESVSFLIQLLKMGVMELTQTDSNNVYDVASDKLTIQDLNGLGVYHHIIVHVNTIQQYALILLNFNERCEIPSVR
jgi:hypothetical protein